jgi:hypothetical protein
LWSSAKNLIDNTEKLKQGALVELEEIVLYHWRMNGKKGGCIGINIPPATRAKLPEASKKSGGNGFSCKAWILSVWKFCKEDINRVLFSLKVGLAVLLVSLLILFEAPYEVFGTSIIWSILTVAIMFEYTVGMYMHAYVKTHLCLFHN